MDLRAALGPDFRLGVATSSYQIEGAVHEDGRLFSVWDTFSHAPGRTKDGGTGDVACDHYHRYEEDLDLMEWLGVDAYRFSVAWPRVLPTGRGAVNIKGLDFYDRLVDGLLSRKISPSVTLYHWDLPQALEDRGGWLNRDTASAFAEFSGLVADRLGDRVDLWLTHNEPWCQAFLGYEIGLFPPGRRDFRQALLCAHHLLLSHGLAVMALRSRVAAPVGIAPNFMPAYPATNREEDILAARRQDGYFNRWFIEPALGLGYPKDMVALYGDLMPSGAQDDLPTIAQPIDVVGVNYYERCIIKEDLADPVLRRTFVTPDGPRTADREIFPPGISDVLQRLQSEYRVPRIVVTENGAATPASESPDEGQVDDAMRVEFFRAHLEELARCRQAGVPVDTYFAWSLMDNFEWSEGYTLRYGVFHVDFDTQKRTPKASAHFLRSLRSAERQ